MKIEKCMIAQHDLDESRTLVKLSSLKPCYSDENKSDFHSDNMKIKMIETSTDAKKKTSEIL